MSFVRSYRVLIGHMRREGYELAVSRTEVIEHEVDGLRCVPGNSSLSTLRRSNGAPS